MPDLLNRWRIVGPGGVDFTFGDYDSRFPLEAQIEITPGEIETKDSRHTNADGLVFGVDTHGGQTVGFTLAALPEVPSWAPGLDLHGQFISAWRDRRLRNRADKITELRHEGRGRMAYGRPRNVAQTLELVRQGWSGLVADFAAVDNLWYDITRSSVAGSAVPLSLGGLVAPLVAPLSTVGEGVKFDYAANDGSEPAPAIVTFTGPSTNPRMILRDLDGTEVWQVWLARSLAFDETAVIDTRRWVRSALVNGRTPIFGALRGDRLDDLTLPPGRFRVEYHATDGTGTSTYELAWHHAYASL